MLRISKILVSLMALVPLFSFALVETHIEPPKDIPVRYSRAHNEKIIREVFGSRADEALKIVQCESGFNNLAVGDGGFSSGLFQIYTKAHKGYSVEQLKDPYLNATVARRIFTQDGWLAWTCRNVL